MSREERGDNLSCRNLSLLRALNPPWKPSGLLNSGDEWSGRLEARVHKHLSSPCPELYITLTILPFPHDNTDCSATTLRPHGNILQAFTAFRPTMSAGGWWPDKIYRQHLHPWKYPSQHQHSREGRNSTELSNVLVMEGGLTQHYTALSQRTQHTRDNWWM